MTELDIYYNNTQSPWGELFYKIIWEQLSFAENLKVLDFGSGFGITANHMAANNDVVAIEPNQEMIDKSFRENRYTQMNGGIELLDNFQAQSFDLIICHNVLEYIEDKEEYISAFIKLLKTGGRLSLVKHNHWGRIMKLIAHDNDIEQSLRLLNGEPAVAQNFGEIKYYDMPDINEWSGKLGYEVIDTLGVRTFFALNSDNDSKYKEDWKRLMFEMELKVSRTAEFRNIAFFHHIILGKI